MTLPIGDDTIPVTDYFEEVAGGVVYRDADPDPNSALLGYKVRDTGADFFALEGPRATVLFDSDQVGYDTDSGFGNKQWIGYLGGDDYYTPIEARLKALAGKRSDAAWTAALDAHKKARRGGGSKSNDSFATGDDDVQRQLTEAFPPLPARSVGGVSRTTLLRRTPRAPAGPASTA